MSQHRPSGNQPSQLSISGFLTLSHTNFRLFQTERVCRRQFQIGKQCGKRRNCSLRAFFFFSHSVFKTIIICRLILIYAVDESTFIDSTDGSRIVLRLIYLTLSQTTSFRLFQTQRVCRIDENGQTVLQTVRKHCGKRRNCT